MSDRVKKPHSSGPGICVCTCRGYLVKASKLLVVQGAPLLLRLLQTLLPSPGFCSRSRMQLVAVVPRHSPAPHFPGFPGGLAVPTQCRGWEPCCPVPSTQLWSCSTGTCWPCPLGQVTLQPGREHLLSSCSAPSGLALF